MKKAITFVMVGVIMLSLTSCVVKNDSTAAANKSSGSAANSAVQTTANNNASETFPEDVLATTLDKSKGLNNCYYELVAEFKGKQQSVVKVWFKDNKTKIQKNNDKVVTYIDFDKNTFVDYDSKTKKATSTFPNQNYIDDLKRYAGAYLANDDYETIIGSLDATGKEDLEGGTCIVGSYEDTTSKAYLYINEQYGVVMKFDFTSGNNHSLAYLTNLKVGSVTVQDVELPQGAKLTEK